MPSVRRKASGRSRDRNTAQASQATLTTAFITNADATLPKGAAGFTFRTPSNAVEVFADKPAKVKPLLKGYGEAVAKSRKAGRTISFRVDVDPSGGATVTPLEETAGAEPHPPSGATEELDDESQSALEEARARGRSRAAEILAGEDMLSADRFAALLGTTRMTVNTKRQNHQVLGLDGAKRGFRFPVWQVGDDGKPFAALPALFERLGGGPWAVYRFLVQAHPELDGLTGREALRRGKTAQALEVADSIAQGTFS